jgi:GntR family carbon starvation induced transcriptional regulator
MGRLLPGTKLNLAEEAKARGVSLTVVREAVTRLASERLMQATPQQGFRVWPLSVPDLLDLTRVRIEIESLTLRESVENGDLQWEAELVAAHHRLAGATPPPGQTTSQPNYAWMRAHSEFHAALAAACTSPLLKQLRQQLFDAAELFRQWTRDCAPSARPRRKRVVHKEHRAMLAAALEHDADKVVELVTQHVQRTTDILLAVAESEPLHSVLEAS